MGFSENLQNLRKINNMSQEQLAEKLEVSRQAVSKWESGNGYPEAEKLIVICDIFDCSMDNLVKGKITVDTTGEKIKYENLQNKFSKGISLGTGIILFGTTLLLYFAGLSGKSETSDLLKNHYGILGVTILLICVLISLPIFIAVGISQDNFKKKNPKLPNFYSEEEIDKFNTKFIIGIATGVSLILIGTILLIILYGMNLVNENSTIPVVVLMSFVTISVPILSYCGIQKDKYDIEKYNENNSEEGKKRNVKAEKICGSIMLTATAIFLSAGLIFNLWKVCWVVFPIGGIFCGIVSTILEKE